jgi:FkbM family methyltransferase
VRPNPLTDIEVRPLAVTNTIGVAPLVTGDHSVGSSLDDLRGNIRLLGPEFIGAAKRIVHVETTSLDASCLQVAKSIQGHCLIKIDVEGAEPLVIERSREIVKFVRAVFIESNVFMLRQHGFTPFHIIREMHSAGFNGFLIPEHGRSLKPIDSAFARDGNLLFLRQDESREINQLIEHF